MKVFQDYKGRIIRLSEERLDHLETEHPEMVSQLERISETLGSPKRVVGSKTDISVELCYKHYPTTPVFEKFLCIVVKTFRDENFVVTAYYTNKIKGGDLLWEKK